MNKSESLLMERKPPAGLPAPTHSKDKRKTVRHPNGSLWLRNKALLLRRIYLTNEDISENQTHIDWVRSFWNQVEPYTKGVYVNHLGGEDEASRVRAAYGPNYDRLVALKAKYDPGNFFRLNNNIAPD